MLAANFIYLVNKLKKDTISAVLLNLMVLLNFPSCLRRFTRLQVLLALYFITLNHTGDTITISVFRRLCTFPLIQRPISRTSLPSVLARPTVRENLMNVTRSYRSAAGVWRRSQLGIGRDWHRTVASLYKADLRESDFYEFSMLARRTAI